MKQGDRRLLVLSGSSVKSFHPNAGNSIVFYDIHILRVSLYFIFILKESYTFSD